MSVRAYRVNNINREDSDTFNLWNDQKLMEFFDFDYNIYSNLNEDGVGIIELPIEALEHALAKKDELELEDDHVTAFAADIAWAKANRTDYVRYYCF